MSEIIELCKHPKFLNKSDQSFYNLCTITEDVYGVPKSIFKFDLISICEVFGYQIAEAIGVRVPIMHGFWVSKALRINQYNAKPGRIGILVKHHEDWQPLGRECAIKLDELQVARALALCTFDRHEWGEFGLSGGKVYFVDLERLLPPINPEALFAATEGDQLVMLNDWALAYDKLGSSAICEVLKEAEQLDIRIQVERELRQLCLLKSDKYCRFQTISGHPLEKLLSRFATFVFGQRLNLIANYFDLPQHEVPYWR